MTKYLTSPRNQSDAFKREFETLVTYLADFGVPAEIRGGYALQICRTKYLHMAEANLTGNSRAIVLTFEDGSKFGVEFDLRAPALELFNGGHVLRVANYPDDPTGVQAFSEVVMEHYDLNKSDVDCLLSFVDHNKKHPSDGWLIANMSNKNCVAEGINDIINDYIHYRFDVFAHENSI